MHLYGMDFERRVLSVFADAAAVRALNPLGQVPVLEIDDGELLLGSAAILDWLDECAGPEHALMPAAGAPRRRVQRALAVATGLAEKCVALRGETVRRRPDKRDPEEAARLAAQIEAACTWLEAEATAGPWLAGSAMTQADVTAAVTVTYLHNKIPARTSAAGRSLRALAARCEDLPAFRAAPFQEG